MYNRELLRIPDLFQRSQRGMQAEVTVEVDNVLLRNRDAWTQRVIRLLTVGDDYVQTVSSSALKQGDQNLPPATRVCARSARQPCRSRACSEDCDRTTF